MQKRKVFINAIMSLVQIIIVSGVLFFLYRFLLKTLGAEKFGIWSLVLATTSIAGIANLGLSGSVVKFVAKYLARGEEENVSAVIQTAMISLAILIGSVLLIGYPLIKLILKMVVPSKSFFLALSILPFALLSLWLKAIASVFQSGLDGFQKIYIRNILVMCSSIFYAVLCFIMAPTKGLLGLAYAQVINSSLLLLISWILIKKFLPVLPIIPYKWNRNIFKEIISYGVNFQAISITTMFYDPITKALLSKFGGLSMVGFYEMASRMIQQFRALIVSANQVLVPSIADLQEKNPEKIRSVYLTNYNLLFYLALPLYSLIIISTPLISNIWVGHYENSFIIFAVLLSIGWFLNTLASASYFANLGTGELRWNVIGHITIAILNAGLGFVFGLTFDGYGVVIAWIFALSLGSAVIYLSYHLINKIPLSKLFPQDSRIMIGIFIVIIPISLVIQQRLNHSSNSLIFNIILILFFLFISLIPLYFHPMRKRLMGWIKELVFQRSTN